MSAPDVQTEMRPDALAHTEAGFIPCDGCQALFKPVRAWQRFHSESCRREYHRQKGIQPLRAKVKATSVLANGQFAVSLRFKSEDQARAQEMLKAGFEVDIL